MVESVRRLMFLMGVYYFLQGMSGNAGLHDQALDRFLIQTLGLGAAQMNAFSFLVTIPWMIKPLYGILADSVPIVGYRIKSYFFTGSILASVAYLGIYRWGYSASSLGKLLVVSAVGIALADVLCDKLMVIKGQPLDATDRLQAAQWFAISLAGILTTFIGGYIAEYVPLQRAVFFSLPFALMVIPVTVFLWEEKRVESVNVAAKEAWSGLKSALRLKPLWGCAIFLFLYHMSPGLGKTLRLYEINVLKFSQIQIGHIDTLGSIGSMIGVFFFGVWCKKFSERWLLRGIVVSGSAATLLYVFFRDPLSAFLITFGAGMVGAVAFLGILTLAARVCPKNAEGMVFALLMSVINFSTKLGGMLGGLLFDTVGFQWLVVISTTTTLVMWFFLPLVRERQLNRNA
mgnify:CR=1 FL=1